MNTHTHESRGSKSQSTGALTAQHNNSSDTADPQFTDDRQEAMVQRKIREMASNSSQARQVKGLRGMASDSPQVKRMAQLKGMANGQANNKPLSIDPTPQAVNQGLDIDDSAQLDPALPKPTLQFKSGIIPGGRSVTRTQLPGNVIPVQTKLLDAFTPFEPVFLQRKVSRVVQRRIGFGGGKLHGMSVTRLSDRKIGKITMVISQLDKNDAETNIQYRVRFDDGSMADVQPDDEAYQLIGTPPIDEVDTDDEEAGDVKEVDKVGDTKAGDIPAAAAGAGRGRDTGTAAAGSSMSSDPARAAAGAGMGKAPGKGAKTEVKKGDGGKDFKEGHVDKDAPKKLESVAGAFLNLLDITNRQSSPALRQFHDYLQNFEEGGHPLVEQALATVFEIDDAEVMYGQLIEYVTFFTSFTVPAECTVLLAHVNVTYEKFKALAAGSKVAETKELGLGPLYEKVRPSMARALEAILSLKPGSSGKGGGGEGNVKNMIKIVQRFQGKFGTNDEWAANEEYHKPEYANAAIAFYDSMTQICNEFNQMPPGKRQAMNKLAAVIKGWTKYNCHNKVMAALLAALL